jgi:hypothetical protein
VRILKNFKYCVLEVRILWELEACFLEVRILKSLEEKTWLAKTRGAEAPHLQQELRGKKKFGEGEGDWLDCDESME